MNTAINTIIRKRPLILAGMSEFAPIAGFVLIFLFFTVITDGKIFSPMTLRSLSNQVLITALIGAGAVFVFGAGAFDMSMSGHLCLTAIIGAKSAMSTGSIPYMVAACLIVSLALGITKGLLAAYVNVPFFIVTIVIGAFLGALGLLVLGKEIVLSISNIAEIKDMTLINIIVLGSVYIAGLILFNYTRIGKSCKLIGGNEIAARQSGIDIEKTKIIAFLFAGLTVGLAAIIILLNTKTASPTTGGTVGIDIMIALVLGGMPLSGGPRSRISAALIGSATITVLNSGLTIMGVGPGTIQIFRGIIFLAVVLVASMNYRTRLLPR